MQNVLYIITRLITMRVARLCPSPEDGSDTILPSSGRFNVRHGSRSDTWRRHVSPVIPRTGTREKSAAPRGIGHNRAASNDGEPCSRWPFDPHQRETSHGAAIERSAARTVTNAGRHDPRNEFPSASPRIPPSELSVLPYPSLSSRRKSRPRACCGFVAICMPAQALIGDTSGRFKID